MKFLVLIAIFTSCIFAEELTANDNSGYSFEARIGYVQGLSGSLEKIIDGVIQPSVSTDTRGVKILLGTSYKMLDDYSYFYLGYETTGISDSDSQLFFLLGAESSIGHGDIKFVYGGELGIGQYQMYVSDINTYYFETLTLPAFSIEPFIGAKYDLTDNFNINIRVGYKIVNISKTTGVNANAIPISSGITSYEASSSELLSAITIGYRF